MAWWEKSDYQKRCCLNICLFFQVTFCPEAVTIKLREELVWAVLPKWSSVAFELFAVMHKQKLTFSLHLPLKQSTHIVTHLHLLLAVLMPRVSLASPLAPAFRQTAFSMVGTWGNRFPPAFFQLKMAKCALLWNCPFIHYWLPYESFFWGAMGVIFISYTVNIFFFFSCCSFFSHQLENHLSVSHFMWYFACCPLG